MAQDRLTGPRAADRWNANGVTKSNIFGAQSLKTGNKAFAMFFKGKLVLTLPQERIGAIIAAGQPRS